MSVNANLADSIGDFGSDYVTKLQESVNKVKHSRSKEREFMAPDDLLEKEHREGREEGEYTVLVRYLKKYPLYPKSRK